MDVWVPCRDGTVWIKAKTVGECRGGVVRCQLESGECQEVNVAEELKRMDMPSYKDARLPRCNPDAGPEGVADM
jgi:hypothetical protein